MGLLTVSLIAQKKDFLTVYEKNVIGYYGSRYIVDGQVMSLQKIKPLLLNYPASANEFSLYKKNARIGFGIYFGALAMDIVALSQIDKNNNASLGLLLGSLAAYGISIPFLNKSTRHLQRSVHCYNRDILKDNL